MQKRRFVMQNPPILVHHSHSLSAVHVSIVSMKFWSTSHASTLLRTRWERAAHKRRKWDVGAENHHLTIRSVEERTMRTGSRASKWARNTETHYLAERNMASAEIVKVTYILA
ncbi:hypothetical protein Tcan_17456 [Toxocara canis]|uniref:Uncharacterized protein n=1 Tax=Toxocara canis TaxID=6265 RepID=A0A0B2VMH9_TOXCA|nr:hypothetical protein Tcan_17456 [Toxocara canis]